MVSLIKGVGFFAGFCLVFAVVFGMAHAVSPKPRILLVDDDPTSYVYTYYDEALDYAGYAYDYIYTYADATPEGPSYDEMKDYDIVIWLTGRSYAHTLLSDDRDHLTQYLDGGGALFLSGEQIPYDGDLRSSNFYRDYLNSGGSNPKDVYNDYAAGYSNDPVSGDLNWFLFKGTCKSCPYAHPYCSEIWNCTKKYILYPLGNGDKTIRDDDVYDVGTSNIEGIRVDSGTFKLVYFGFGLEQMHWGYFDWESYTHSALWGNMLKRVINYLYAPYTINVVVSPALTNTNPVINATCVDMELFSYVNASEYFVRNYANSAPSREDYGAGTVLYPKDGGFDEAVEVVNGTVDIFNLTDGNYTVYVHCKDKSGYWGRFDNFTFEVDKTAPNQPDYIVVENNKPYTNKVFAYITVVGPSANIPDFMRFSCNDVNYTGWVEFGGGFDDFNITGSQFGCSAGDGSRTVYVNVGDLAGNIQAIVIYDDITLDRVSPKYVHGDFYPENNSYVPANPQVSYNVTDDWDFSKVIYDAGGGNSTVYSGSGFVQAGWLVNGEERLDLWAYDKAGNVNYTYLRYFVDVNAPSFDAVGPENNSYLKTVDNVTINVSDNFNVSSLWYNNNAGSGNVTVDINSSFNPDWTSEGEQFLDVWINDTSGNLNYSRYRFVVDDTLPGIFSISYQNESNVTSNFSFVVNTTDNYGVSLRYYSTESGGENKTFEDLVSFVPGWVGDGPRSLLLWVFDAAGNVFYGVYSYFVDDTAPYIVDIDPCPGSVVRSDANISIDADDTGVGISWLVYSNSSCGVSKAFTDSVGFNPGWSGDGAQYLLLWINDTLGNMNYTYYTYTVDDTLPVFVSVDPENGSYVSSRSNITVVLSDVNGMSVSWYNNGSANITFDSSYSFNPGWSADGGKDLYVWANDTAGNVNETLYYFVVDDSSPLISLVFPANGSFIKNDDSVILNSTDYGAGVDKLWYFNGSGVNHTVSGFVGFVPGWSADGDYTLDVWSNDMLDNVNYSVFWFYVDTTGPDTGSNYTSSGWVNEDQDVLLACNDGDGVGCNVTMSCVRNYGSTECLSYSELDMINVSCTFGETCQKYVHFRSNDSLGNYGPFNDTAIVRIDKEAPSITVQNPKGMQVVSGMVDILTGVADSGIGVNASWYDINVTAANGTLNESSGWDAVWNSSGVSDGIYNLTVHANDSFGYARSISVLFRVDNNLPTAAIYYPEEVYLNSGFSLDLRAMRIGGNLTNCSYYIYNSTQVLNWSIKYVSSFMCNFSWGIDTSLWSTGNYSINFTAFDGIGNNVSRSAWFVFDADNPVVSVNSPADSEWTCGVISINYSTGDDYIDECYYRYKNGQGLFSDYYLIGCGNLLEFGFDTEVHCSDTDNAGCLIQLNSTDKAGNSNHANVSFNVDNSRPVVSISTPAENSWQNGTFSVGHSEVDPQGQTCSYRVAGSGDSSWIAVGCSVLFDVFVSSYCQNEGWSSCSVFVNSTNNVGDAVVKSRNFSIDLFMPWFVSVIPQNGSFVKSSANIRVDADDLLSGVAGLMYDNGSGTGVSVVDNEYFNPGWSGDGNKSLGVWVTDVAGNVNYSLFSYFVDDASPYVDSVIPVNGSSIRLNANLTVDAADDGAGVAGLKFDNNNEFSENVSFYDNVSFDPFWSSGGNKTLDLWLEDVLGNLNHTVLKYFVDTVAPDFSVFFPNGSYIRSGDNITADAVDVGIGVDSGWYYAGYGPNVSFAGGVSFNPGWVSEGTKQIIFYANDSFGNFNSLLQGYVVDDSLPMISRVWTNATAVKEGGHVLVSVNVSDNCSGVDSVFVDVLNTTMQCVCRVLLNNSGSSGVYSGTVVINGADTGNYTLNISSNDTVGWISYASMEVVVDNNLPVIKNPMFDVDIDALYSDKRIYRNETVSFIVNVSDRQADSVVATVDAPYGVANYSLLPVNGNYSDDAWSFTLYNTSVPGVYSISAVYANDTVGNVNVTNSGLDEFIVVSGRLSVLLGGKSYVSAGENKSVNISFDFNRTLDNPNVTVCVPMNTLWSSLDDIYFLNNSVFVCGYGDNSCSFRSGVDGFGKVMSINVSGNSSGSSVSLYSSSVTPLYPLNDSNMTWYAEFMGYVYSNNTVVRTPYLNVSSVLCDGVSGCVVNQSEEFVLNVSVDNVYQAGNHTGCAHDVVLDVSVGLLQLNCTLGTILSGSGKSTGLAVNVTSAGNFTMSLVAGDSMLMYNSSVLNISLEVRDTEFPRIYNPFLDGSNKVYLNESVSLGAWVDDNINVSSVWASLKTPDNAFENRSFYLDMGNRRLGVWKFSYNQTFLTGAYNITDIYSNDTAGNIVRMPLGYVFNVLNMTIVTGLSLDILNVSDSITIYANVSSNATLVEKVEAVISKPRGAVEVELLSCTGSDSNGTHFYELNYDNVSRSGNYSVDVSVYSGKNVSSSELFFANFGDIDVVYSGSNTVLFVPVNHVSNITWFIVPVGGDLVNVNASVLLDNASVVNLTNADFNVSVGNVTVEDSPYGYMISWELNFSGIGLSNLTVNVESSALGVLDSETILLNVTDADAVLPSVSDSDVEYRILNLYEVNSVYVNVSDNSLIDNVSFEVYYPLGTVLNYTADIISPGRYRLDFSNVSETGNFSCMIYAYDIFGNLGSRNCSSGFGSVDEYSVSIVTDYNVYNKGENISFTMVVNDVNNATVDGYNLTLFLNVPGSLEYLVDDEVRDSSYKYLSVYDEPTVSNNDVVYTVNASVYKNENRGASLLNLTVSSGLVTDIISLDYGDYYTVGDIVPISVSVSNKRGEGLADARVKATYESVVYEFEHLTSNVYVNADDFYAPPENSFGLIVDSVDSFKNGGSDSVVLTTVKSVTPTTSSSSSSGSGSGGGRDMPVFGGNETEVKDENEKVKVALPRSAFDFTITDSEVEVVSGFNVTFFGYIANTGEMPLVIRMGISKDCCDVFVDEEFELQVGNSFDFPVSVYAPLSMLPGEYVIQITLSSGSQEKLKTVMLRVYKNPDVLAIEKLRRIMIEIKSEVEVYEADGFDVAELKVKLEEVERLLSIGEDAIENDEVLALSSIVPELQKDAEVIESSLVVFRVQKFLLDNKEMILLFLIMLFFSVYLITEIILPYLKLKDALIRLNRKQRIIEKTKRATEKQYFTRKISEEVFNRIMVEEQGKLLKTRSEIGEIEEYMSVLKNGKVREFKRLKSTREGKRRDVLKMQTMENALSRSTGDFLRVKLENSKMRLFLVKLWRIVREGFRKKVAGDSFQRKEGKENER